MPEGQVVNDHAKRRVAGFRQNCIGFISGSSIVRFVDSHG